MFKFQITINLLAADGSTIAIPLPAVETPAALGSVLNTVENLIKPFLPVVEAVAAGFVATPNPAKV
ncbi:MAG TPA: hypothetical protein VIL78_00645 [Hanamia sp.]